MFNLLFTVFLVQAAYLDLQQKGHILLDKGDIKGAEIVLKESLSKNPDHIPALKDLGEVYVRLKQFPEALNQYKRVVELNPKDIHARSRLAELYSWTGDYDNAIIILKSSLELDPKNIGIKTALAKILRWSHRYIEAETLYKEALHEIPTDHEALKGLAKTYAIMGDLHASLDIIDRALKLYPDDAELYKEKGTVLAWHKDFNNAIVFLKKSIELSPDYIDAYKTMADVYLWMKDYKNAAETYKNLSEIEPANIEHYIAMAAAYKTLGKFTMAEEAVKTALKIDPVNTEALDMLRSIRGGKKLEISKIVGEIVEFLAFFFVFILLIFATRYRKRMIKRRHKIYTYFINFILPILIFSTFITFIGRNPLSLWIDIHLLEEIIEAILFFSIGISLLVILWTEHRSHEFMKTVILTVGAHPDDIELGCGGYLMKAKDSGARVYGLILTKGEKGTDKTGRRAQEFEKAAKFMELDDFWILDFPDTELKNSIPQIKETIENKIKELGATTVLAHSAIDIHSDHQAVFEATKEAARDRSILCYEDVSTPKEFVPNYYVDISGYIEDKMKLITFHKTQEEKTYMDPEVIKGRAAHRGLQGNVQYAEAFRVHQLLK